MVARRPTCHIASHLTDPLQGRQRLHSIHLRPVAPRHRGKIPMAIKTWGVALAGAPLACRRRRRGVALPVRHQRLATRVKLRLTRRPRLLQKLLLLQGLLEGKALRSAPVPFPRLGDRRLIVLATPLPVARQALGLALTGADGAENRHARLAVHITDDLGPFAGHLLQGLLHRLDRPRGHGHQPTALS